MNFKIYFFISTSILFIILTILVAVGKLSSFPKPIIIVGTITILVMNILQPLIEFLYKKAAKNKMLDIKGNSFIISLVISLSTAIFSNIILQNMNWFELFIKNGFVWGVNTAILLLNIAYLEIKNNNLVAEEKYNKRIEELLEWYEDKEELKKLRLERRFGDYNSEGEENERKNKNRD